MSWRPRDPLWVESRLAVVGSKGLIRLDADRFRILMTRPAPCGHSMFALTDGFPVSSYSPDL